MYKILLVDDESIILEGLSTVIDWEKYNCCICDTANNAVSGIEKIKSLHPDIIITDIKMDNMSGLDMLHETKEYIQNSRVIIITGYRDFDYAAEAIELGVSALLLKPLKLDKLEDAINRAVSYLNCLTYNTTSKEIYEETGNEFSTIQSYMDNKHPIPIYLFKKSIDLNNYAVATFDCDSLSNPPDNQTVYAIINSYFSGLSDNKLMLYPIETENSCLSFFVVSHENEFNLQNFVFHISNVQSLILSNTDTSYSVGISSIGTNNNSLESIYHESLRTLKYKEYIGKKSIIIYEDIKMFFEASFDNIGIDEIQKTLLELISTGAVDKLSVYLDEIEDYILNISLTKDFRKWCYDIISRIFSININLENSFLNLDSIQSMINNADNPLKNLELISIIAKESAKKINSYNIKKISTKLNNAIDYINKNLNKNISLSEVAKAIYVSPSHLSTMFKKKLNIRFTDYVIKIKMEYAVKLLTDGNYKIYEISNLVGINDSLYFSRLFKKHTGVSPSEYRNNVRTAELNKSTYSEKNE